MKFIDIINTLVLERRIRDLEKRQQNIVEVLHLLKESINNNSRAIVDVTKQISERNQSLNGFFDNINDFIVSVDENLRITNGRVEEILKRRGGNDDN